MKDFRKIRERNLTEATTQVTITLPIKIDSKYEKEFLQFLKDSEEMFFDAVFDTAVKFRKTKKIGDSEAVVTYYGKPKIK